MGDKNVRIAVTGAAGQLGYALLFRIAAGEMFGPDTRVRLHLLELERALPALQGIVMELEDCAFPLLEAVMATADPSSAFDDVDWAILIGSVPRQAGMERGDLLAVNGKIFIQQGRVLNEKAKTSCRVLVVGNPCNTNAFAVKETAKDIPDKNFFAMTMLDQHRAVAQIALKASACVSDVKNLAVWGNHSSTQFPDFFHATIKGKPVEDVIKDKTWLETTFIKTVQKRGMSIIQARGVSSAASAANAVIDTVKCLLFPTPQGQFFSVAVSSDGSYNIPKGLMFSFPVRFNGQQWYIVPDLQHGVFAKEKLNTTLNELLEEKGILQKLIS